MHPNLNPHTYRHHSTQGFRCGPTSLCGLRPRPQAPSPTATPTHQADELVNVQPLVPVGLEDAEDEAVQEIPSLLQAPTLFTLSFQVCLRREEPHVAPPWPGLLAVIANLEHT